MDMKLYDMSISTHNNLFSQLLPWNGNQKASSQNSCKMLSLGTPSCVISTPFTSRCIATSAKRFSSILATECEKVDQSLVGGLSRDELIKEHTRTGAFADAVRVYVNMLENGVCMTNVSTFLFFVKAVGRINDTELGRQVHGHLLKLGLLSDIYVANSLLAMVWKLREADDAVKMFDKMQNRDPVSWSTMLSGFNRSTHHNDALEYLYKMVREYEVYPNQKGCTSALSSCGSIRYLIHGREIQGFVIRSGWDMDDFIVNALIHMYMSCGIVYSAQLVFKNTHEILKNNTVLWNVLIQGYADNGYYSQAAFVLVSMTLSGIEPDSSTIVT